MPPLLIAVIPAFGLAAVSVVTPLTPAGAPENTPVPLSTVVEVIAVLALYVMAPGVTVASNCAGVIVKVPDVYETVQVEQLTGEPVASVRFSGTSA